MPGSAMGSFGGLLPAGQDTGWGHVHVLMWVNLKIHLFVFILAFHCQRPGVFDYPKWVFVLAMMLSKADEVEQVLILLSWGKMFRKCWSIHRDMIQALATHPKRLLAQFVVPPRSVNNRSKTVETSLVELSSWLSWPAPAQHKRYVFFLLFWQFSGRRTFYVSNCVDRKVGTF